MKGIVRDIKTKKTLDIIPSVYSMIFADSNHIIYTVSCILAMDTFVDIFIEVFLLETRSFKKTISSCFT